MNSGAPDQVRKISIELQVPRCGFFGSVRFRGDPFGPAARESAKPFAFTDEAAEESPG